MHTCQGAYALKKFYSQELSSRIGKETEFETLQLEGEIAENVIKNIENAKKYLNKFGLQKLSKTTRQRTKIWHTRGLYHRHFRK
ncbi:hypothetical protein BSPWISOXPB_7443 [uncultured Gammaproteobacteria bacterium]|nr:hypothetical protein BSPWISOXPB_7443 [uncultured Gammaproteobacteria bacterium]